MHVEGLNVQSLDEPPAKCAHSGKASVPLGLNICRNAAGGRGQKVSWRLPKVTVRPDPLHAQSLDREALTCRHVCIVGSGSTTLPCSGQSWISVHAAEQRNRIAGVAVRICPDTSTPNWFAPKPPNSVMSPGG